MNCKGRDRPRALSGAVSDAELEIQDIFAALCEHCSRPQGISIDRFRELFTEFELGDDVGEEMDQMMRLLDGNEYCGAVDYDALRFVMSKADSETLRSFAVLAGNSRAGTSLAVPTVDEDYELSIASVKAYYDSMQLSEEENRRISQFLEAVDVNQDGKLSFQEFALLAYRSRRGAEKARRRRSGREGPRSASPLRSTKSLTHHPGAQADPRSTAATAGGTIAGSGMQTEEALNSPKAIEVTEVESAPSSPRQSLTGSHGSPASAGVGGLLSIGMRAAPVVQIRPTVAPTPADLMAKLRAIGAPRAPGLQRGMPGGASMYCGHGGAQQLQQAQQQAGDTRQAASRVLSTIRRAQQKSTEASPKAHPADTQVHHLTLLFRDAATASAQQRTQTAPPRDPGSGLRSPFTSLAQFTVSEVVENPHPDPTPPSPRTAGASVALPPSPAVLPPQLRGVCMPPPPDWAPQGSSLVPQPPAPRRPCSAGARRPASRGPGSARQPSASATPGAASPARSASPRDPAGWVPPNLTTPDRYRVLDTPPPPAPGAELPKGRHHLAPTNTWLASRRRKAPSTPVPPPRPRSPRGCPPAFPVSQIPGLREDTAPRPRLGGRRADVRWRKRQIRMRRLVRNRRKSPRSGSAGDLVVGLQPRPPSASGNPFLLPPSRSPSPRAMTFDLSSGSPSRRDCPACGNFSPGPPSASRTPQRPGTARTAPPVPPGTRWQAGEFERPYLL